MFMIKAHKPGVIHHYTAECFAENTKEGNKNIVIDAPAQPGMTAKQYLLALEGDQAYDTIEVRNMQGTIVETFFKHVPPPAEIIPPKPKANRKARRTTAAKRKPRKK